jgi:serralysin
MSTQTIAEIAAGNPDFSLLVRALEATDLTDAVADPNADFTVLAPTNAAFGQLAADLGFGGDTADEDAVFNFLVEALAPLSPDNDAVAVLTDVLLYHVLPGAQTTNDIAAAESLTTALAGASITPAGSSLIDLEPDVVDPTIAAGNVVARNGIVHVLDRVLLPVDIAGNEPTQTIAEIAAASDDFNILVRALQTADLVDVVADDAADLLVFAPTDAAFGQLAADLGFAGDATDEDAVFTFLVGALTDLSPDGDPVPLLTDILLYHVAPEARSAAQIATADSIPTALSGTALTALGSVISDNEPDIANPTIAVPDVLASNGVIQGIDRVLLPLDLAGNAPDQSIADIATGSSDFDLLVRALQAADLTSVVANPDADFTVMAPTDAAFTDLAVRLGFRGDISDEDAVFNSIVGSLTALSSDGDPIPLLTDVLLYHVLPGGQTLSQLAGADAPLTTALAGATLGLDGTQVVDLEPDLDDASVAIADVAASNGVIQAIDKVLLPIDLPNDGTPQTVTGTGDDDVLVGSAEAEVFVAGSGADTIIVGGGADVVAGRLSDLSGDTIQQFGTDDIVSISDQVVRRADAEIDDGSVTIGDASFVIDSQLGEGDFIFSGNALGTDIGFVGFRAALSEETAVEETAINGVVAQQFLNGDTSNSFSVTFEADAAAGYDNSIGAYEVNADGELVDVRIIAQSVKAAAGTGTTVTGIDAGNAFGFFLIQDGANRFGDSLFDADSFAFVERDGSSPTLTADGVAFEDATIFFSTDPSLNASGLDQVLSGVAQDGSGALQLGFEDLARNANSDNDFQDVLLTVDIA